MCLRIEEDLGMHNAISRRMLEIIPSKAFEVVLGDEAAHADVVIMQKVIQTGEVLVSLVQSGYRAECGIVLGKRDGVVFCEVE